MTDNDTGSTIDPENYDAAEGLDQLQAEDSQTGAGEPLDDQVDDERSGRLVAPDEGAHADLETDAVAEDIGSTAQRPPRRRQPCTS